MAVFSSLIYNIKASKAYIVCYLCEKKFKANPKKDISEEAKKHGMYRVEIINLKGGGIQSFYICEECANKLINKEI